MRNPLYSVGCAVLVAFLLPVAAFGDINSYSEAFNTTTYKNPSTTALWSTSTGELKLPFYDLQIVGSVDTPRLAQGLTVHADYAYVCDTGEGVQVVDISDPTQPSIVKTLNTNGLAYSATVYGDYLYIADYNGGLVVANIVDPPNAFIVGSVLLYAFANEVVVCGDYAYVAVWAGGFYVVDVSDPTSPTVVANYTGPEYGIDIVLDGNYVYIADSGFFTKGVHVIDINDPTNPVPVTLYSTTDGAYGVDVEGDYLYVATYLDGLTVLDISDPTVPSFVASADTPQLARDVWVSGNYAYVADGRSGMQVIDVTDPAAPVLVGGLATGDQALALRIDGDHAFIADRNAGLQVVKIADSAPLGITGSLDTPSFTSGIAVAGDYAFIGDASSGMHVVDISDPAMPSIVDTYNTPGLAQGLTVDGDELYVTDYTGGLVILDITDPTNVTGIKTVPMYAFANDVTVCGNYAYVAVWAGGLYVIDVSDPANAVQVGNLPTPEYAYDIQVIDNYAYIADSGFNSRGLHIIDVSDPTNPQPVTVAVTPSSAFGVAIAGNYAFVADYDMGLQVINIADPAFPFIAGSVDTPGLAYDVTLVGNYAYVSDRAEGVQVVDISDPTNPTIVDNVTTNDFAQASVYAGEHLFVADWEAGLTIAKVNERGIDISKDFAASTLLDVLSAPIRSARLATDQVGTVDWRISTDSGATWESMVADGEWQSLTTSGTDIQWDATLNAPQAFNTNTVVSQLDIDWLYDFAAIDSVTDVNGDDGGWARVYFTRSHHDVSSAAAPISAYNIHRRVDDPALAAAITQQGTPITESTNLVFDDERFGTAFASGTLATATLRFNDRYFRRVPASATIWEVVGTVLARQDDQYVAAVPSVSDFPAHSVYFVSAHTTTPTVFYDSPPDSGQSRNDSPPSAPLSLSIAYNTGSGNQLSWSAPPESDLDYYRVYRSTDPSFEATPEHLVAAVNQSLWTDPDYDSGLYQYKVTAVDDAGNEGPAATATVVTGVRDTLPNVTSLSQNLPNPFNPTTTIRYALGSGGSVKLTIYDVRGRLVRTLVNDTQSVGNKSVQWNGRNDRGQRVTSGVYFYRLTAPGFERTRKMTLLQ